MQKKNDSDGFAATVLIVVSVIRQVPHTRNLDGSVCELYIQVSYTRFSYEFLVQETWIVCQGPTK